jgi:hypothetical protein
VLSLLERLTPQLRVAMALFPFALALVLRIFLGKNRITRAMVSIGTVWFVVNVLLAPYSVRMQQNLHELRYIFR